MRDWEQKYREANEEISLDRQVRERIVDTVKQPVKQQMKRSVRPRRFRPLYAGAFIGAAALIVLLVFGGGSLSDNLGGDMGAARVLAAAEDPEGVGFDDWDARRDRRETYGPVEEELSQGIRRFAAESASLVLGEKQTENMCYSPLSFYVALAMTAQTAHGQTQEEILSCLHHGEAGLSDSIYCLLQLLYEENKITRVKTANSLWLNDRYFTEESEQNEIFSLLAQKYLASSYMGSFGSDELAKAMADWVSKQTGGILGADKDAFVTDADGALSLISTLYYYDQWYDRFDASKNIKDSFTTADGRKITAEYMCATKNPYPVLAADGYTAVSLSMKGGSQITFVLPDEGYTPGEILENGDAMERILGLVQEPETENAEVRIRIPKYAFHSDLDLTQAAKEMGIRAAFSQDEADFTALEDEGNIPVWLSGIRQQTSMSIDEKGCEAAAFTQVDYAGAAMPLDRIVEFYLNRPFLIIVTKQEMPLFIGVINQT